MRALNKSVTSAITKPERGLICRPLKVNTVHMKIYVDVSLASNEDHSFQIGFLILLSDDTNKCHVLHYASDTSRRVVDSIMSGEIFAFLNAFNASFAMILDLRFARNYSVSIRMYADLKQVFDVITCGKRPTKRHLAIDLTAVQDV